MFRSSIIAILMNLQPITANAQAAFWYPSDPACKKTAGNLVPRMTSDTTPSGQASASGTFGTYLPYYVFDQISTTGWFEDSAVVTGWLQYMFATAKVIRKYSIVPAALYATAAPRDWSFQGSQDGSTWTTLDSRTGEAFATDTTLKTFTFSNSTAYIYYRIDITLNNGDSSWLGIGALSLCEF